MRCLVSRSRSRAAVAVQRQVEDDQPELVAQLERAVRRAQIDGHHRPRTDAVHVDAAVAQVGAQRAGHGRDEYVVDLGAGGRADRLDVGRARPARTRRRASRGRTEPFSGELGSGDLRSSAASMRAPSSASVALATSCFRVGDRVERRPGGLAARRTALRARRRRMRADRGPWRARPPARSADCVAMSAGRSCAPRPSCRTARCTRPSPPCRRRCSGGCA